MLVTIGTLVLDCALDTHDAETEITEHPVELGFNVSDHKRQKPRKLTIAGIVTESPIGDSLAAGQRAAQDQALAYDPSVNTQAAMDQLEAMDGSTDLLTVTTGIRTYQNMGIESINVPRDGQTGAALRFTVKLKQVRIVENKLTTVPKTAIRHATVHLGKTADSPNAPAPPRNSLLYDGGSAVFGTTDISGAKNRLIGDQMAKVAGGR